MEKNDKPKVIDIKNVTLLFCWHNNNDLDFANILINQKSYENILIYDVTYIIARFIVIDIAP